jgi:Early Flowering 4 domain
VNHEGRAPEALARNHLLIRELNGNIAKASMPANPHGV